MNKKKDFIHPYIPNSVPSVKQKMLKEVGVKNIDKLYEDVPEELRLKTDLVLLEPILSELELKRHVLKILDRD